MPAVTAGKTSAATLADEAPVRTPHHARAAAPGSVQARAPAPPDVRPTAGPRARDPSLWSALAPQHGADREVYFEQVPVQGREAAHRPEQASGQTTLLQQQPVIACVLYQPPARLDQALLQAGQWPALDALWAGPAAATDSPSCTRARSTAADLGRSGANVVHDLRKSSRRSGCASCSGPE